MKNTIKKYWWALPVVLALIAASQPIIKTSSYPTTTTNDVTDLFLLARTNDVTAPTNYNIKFSNVKKSMTNESATFTQLTESTNRVTTNATAAVTEQTNRVTTNITAAVTEQTNRVTTNFTAAVTEQTNRVTTNITAAVTEQTNRVTTNITAAVSVSTNNVVTNLLSKVVDWTARTNGIANSRAMQFVLDRNFKDFWITNSLAATNSAVVVTYNGVAGGDSFPDITVPIAVVVPVVGVIHVQWDVAPDNDSLFSVFLGQ